MAAPPPPDPRPARLATPRALRLWDSGSVAVLLGTFALQLFAWSQLEGYQLADAVEYMDRAWAVAQGRPLDPGTVRSFAFSAVLLPFFLAAEWLGLEDLRPVVGAVRLAQMGLGLAAVWLVARAGARLWGRAPGLACGAFLGFNPIFVQYSISPLSATAALLALAFALELLSRVEERRAATLRAGLALGATLGLAVLMAFKTIPIVALIVIGLLLVPRWRRAPFALGAAATLGLGVLVQCLLDLAAYGRFGASLESYLLSNVAPMIAGPLYKLGLEDFALRLYEAMPGADATAGGSVRSRFPRWWYLTELTDHALVWPAAALAALGALRVLATRRALPLLALVVCVVFVGLLSLKGHKTFRLWMPLLPFVALVAGAGWALVFAHPRGLPQRVAGPLGAVTLIGVGALGAGLLGERNLAKYGGYWRAVDRLAQVAEREGETFRVASAYDWAARFRERPGLELVKLPAHLDQWPKLDETEREAVLATLAELDGFIGHLQVIEQDPEILRTVNERFELLEVIDDREAMEELEPIYVLGRRSGDPRARTFYAVHTDTAEGQPNWPPAYQARIEHPRSVDFRRRMPDGSVRQMVLLGIDVEEDLAGGDQAWISYHWYAGPLGGADYTVVDRFTDGEGRGYNDNHRPTRGAVPTSEWQEGWIVRESFLTRFAPHPADFGGNWRRGELQPVELWMAIVEFDAEDRAVGGLAPFHPSGGRPIHRERAGGGFASDDGRVWSNDALLRIGGFFLPIPPAERLPDDGRPVEARSSGGSRP